MFVVLTVAIAVTCLVVAYSAWSWRLAPAERPLDGTSVDPDADADALRPERRRRLRDLGPEAGRSDPSAASRRMTKP